MPDEHSNTQARTADRRVVPLRWVALSLFVLTLTLYVHTLAPTITWAHDGYDAGDLITAAYQLGIPHPSGYPTYMLLARLFILLPFGDIAYRVNLLSAVSSATAVALLGCAAAKQLGRRSWALVAAVVGALFLAVSPVFWSQAIITEVYALHCALFGTLALLALNLSRHESGAPADGSTGRRLIALALLFGLSLGNHLTTTFIAPWLLMISVRLYRQRAVEKKHLLQALVALVGGLAVYLYLPLRAGKQPLLNWGDPRTMAGLWWVMSGVPYRGYALAVPPAQWLPRALAWLVLLRTQFGPVGLGLALLGAWRQAHEERLAATGLSLTALLISVYAAGYNTTDSYVYLLPVYWVFALWIAYGSHTLLDHPGVQRWHLLIAVGLVAIPLASLPGNAAWASLRHDDSALQYAIAALDQAGERAMIVSATDAHTFTLWYYQQVVVQQKEVAIVDRDLLGYEWYVRGLVQEYPWLLLPDSFSDGPRLPELLQLNAVRLPIYFTDPEPRLPPQYRLEQGAVLYRLVSQ